MPIYLSETTISTADSLTPRDIVRELDKYVVGQHQAKRAVAIALAQSHAAAEAARGAGRGHRAEEHPDDRPDRRRQDRDRPASGSPGAVAVHQGRSVEVHRGRLRRTRRRVDGARPRRAGGRHGPRRADRRSAREGAAGGRGARPRSAAAAAPVRVGASTNTPAAIRDQAQRTREKLREQLRDGRLDQKTVEIDVREKSFPSFEIIAGSSVEEVDINVKDMLPGLFQGRMKKRRMRIPEALKAIRYSNE